MKILSSKFWLCVLRFAFFTVVFLFVAGAARETTLRDGFVLSGVDGKLATQDSNEQQPDKWLFEFDSELSDGKGRVCAGTSLELLPSATLEKMTANAKQPIEASYRLWGRITKYRGTNFIFPTYFLPLSKIKPLEPSNSQQTKKAAKSQPTINEPNDALAIPQEILNKLESRKIVRTEPLLKGLELKQDSILANKIGFIIEQSQIANGEPVVSEVEPSEIGNRKLEIVFIPDALGRGVQLALGGFGLLPCEALERVQGKQSDELEPLRFNIAGIVTSYKGKNYLLLQRATRVYSHGNFAR